MNGPEPTTSGTALLGSSLASRAGIITGIGTVNGATFGEAKARCAVLAYDYTVNGATTRIELFFDDRFTRFKDLAERS